MINQSNITHHSDANSQIYADAMLRANELAQQGLGLTAPNPIVGAVIIDELGQEVSSGFHVINESVLTRDSQISSEAGDHAEIVAIKSAVQKGFSDFSKCTMVVTLEPCNHHGKTPPCSAALVSAGFKRVVYSLSDPNPKAAGGAEHLRQAGIEVISGVQVGQTQFSNRAWLGKIKNGKPWIVSKIACTMDGKIAALDGTSKWITSDLSRQDVAKLRLQSDAILTSTATVLADDPQMIPRVKSEISGIQRKQNPVRVIMGEREIPSKAKIFDAHAPTKQLLTRDFKDFLGLAQQAGWNQVLVEAGAQFNTELLRKNLIDELILYVAPSILGVGKSFVGDLGINTLQDRLGFGFGEVKRVGAELRIQMFKSDSQLLNNFAANFAGGER